METQPTQTDETVQAGAANTGETSQAVAPLPPAKKKSPLGKILLGLLILALLTGTGGLGYKGYTLTNELAATQARLDDLQGQYDQLQADNEKLGAEIAQTQSDAEQANTDTTTAQDDLKKVKEDAKSVADNLEDVEMYSTIMESIFVKQDSNVLVFVWVLLSEDKELISLYEKLLENTNDANARVFFSYLIQATMTALKK